MMIIDIQRMDHSQEPEQERTLQRQKLRQECKKRALGETTERPKKEIITELRRKQRLTNYSQKRCHLSGSGKKKKIGSKKTSASKKKKTTQKL